MALGQSIRNAIGTAWRGILGAVSAGQSGVQTVSEAVQNILPEVAPPALLDTAVVDQLSSMAQSWVAAKEAFGAAADEDEIDSSMITLAPWSMDLNAYNAQPGYHLVVGINVEGQQAPVFRTITGVDSLPATVGELRATSFINATAMSVGTTPGGGIGGTVDSIDSITITVGPALG
jgi:hypothetical protein